MTFHPEQRDGAFTIGVISDTHGLIRPEALRALGSADLIIHAGDVGTPEVLSALGNIARVVAVRGNTDRGPWATALPLEETLEIGGILLHVVHDIEHLSLDPAAAGVRAVIHGHSHRPSAERRHGVLFLNPGSAGPRRFTLPVTVALLSILQGSPSARIVTLG